MSLNPLTWFRSRHTPTENSHRRWGLTADDDRFRDYARYDRAYHGFRSRLPAGTSYTTAQYANFASQRNRRNFNRPIIHFGAAFLAAKPLEWKVADNEAAQEKAFDIWDRSGAERTFLDAARCCGIYGEVVGLATKDAEGRAQIEFKCPDIAFPTFKGSDAQELVELEIAWEEEDRQGRRVQYREFFTEAGRELFIDQAERPAETQAWDFLPVRWIRNSSVPGKSFGISDLVEAADLVDAYDHLCRRHEKMLDYYASPTIVFEGVDDSDINKTDSTMFFIPAGAKVYFLEWQGTPPDVELHLTRLRNDLSEVTQVPAVAFGRQDSGLSAISGIALKILYGPLLSKTNDKRGSWGPCLEYLMWLCLQAEGVNVPVEAVGVKWKDPLPEDFLALVEEETKAVEAGFHSTRTAMGRLGVEDIAQELKDIEAEQEDPLGEASTGFEKGLMTRNESRARMGLPPVAEDDEDEEE